LIPSTAGLAIGLPLLTFVLAALFVVDRIRHHAYRDRSHRFKVRALYAINERYRELMQLDSTLAKAIGFISLCTLTGPLGGSR
jgi:hypothetical protein